MRDAHKMPSENKSLPPLKQHTAEQQTIHLCAQPPNSLHDATCLISVCPSSWLPLLALGCAIAIAIAFSEGVVTLS